MKLFRKAVLIIHGFTGKLQDNEYLMNYLEYDSAFDVYARTLPGHEKERFSNAKVDDWKEFVDKEIEKLITSGYHTIYIVGHSMGGILATYVAWKYKEIKKIVLVNAAFEYANTGQSSTDKKIDFSKYSKLWEKILKTSPLIFREFNSLVKESKNFLKGVRCKTLILRSLQDEVVPYEAGDIIYKNISTDKKWITDIKGAYHTVLSGSRKEVVSEYIKYFLKGGRLWKKNYKKEI